MKRALITVAFGALMGVSQLYATVETELVISETTEAVTNSVTITVDNFNTISCSGSVIGCADLEYFPAKAHGKIVVDTINDGGFFGYSISITANGRMAAIPPELQELDQLDAKTTSGPGTLTTTFTDTLYTDFPNQFGLSTSGNNGGAPSSTASFNAYNDTTLIGSFPNETGSSFNKSGTFPNPLGPNGSLTTQTIMAFAGPETMQTTFTIDGITPEPTSALFFGTLLIGTVALYRRKAKRS